MLFKSGRLKRTAAKIAAENETEFRQAAEDIRAEFAAARDIADAGERYLALHRLEETASKTVSDGAAKVREQVRGLASGNMAIFVGTGLGLFGAGVVASLVMMNPLPAIAGLAGYVTGAVGSMPLKASEEEPLFKPIFRSLHELDAGIGGLVAETQALQAGILRENLKAVAASPQFDTLYDTVPAVKEAFLKASAREAVLEPQPAALDKPRPGPRP